MSNSVTKIGIVGTGWRAEFFHQLARALPEHFTVVGAVARRPEAAELMVQRWGTSGYTSPAEMVRDQRPDFVVSAVPWAANATVVLELVQAGTRVLCETPPAPDVAAMRALWTALGDGVDRVQVAEQYLRMPGHASRAELVRQGIIGQIGSVQVSSTHGYHAVSLMRGLLGAGFGPATVRAAYFEAPLVDPLSRDGWTGNDDPKPAATVLATIDFGPGQSGLYDFTDNQWHNQLRARRIVIRGSLGEIVDDHVVRLAAPATILRSDMHRAMLGLDLNLDGFDTEHLSFEGQVLYRNPFLGSRFMDEEIAIASLLRDTARWSCGDGPAPYPLAQGCQDQLISLAIDEAVTTGQPVTTQPQPWGH